MNYRHIFHAGNFADVLKHAALVATLPEYRIRSAIRDVGKVLRLLISALTGTRDRINSIRLGLIALMGGQQVSPHHRPGRR